MATYRLKARPKSSIVTMEFDYYNEAMAFYAASQPLSPSKPYKRGAKWCVSMTREPDAPKVELVADWVKPGVYISGILAYSAYDDWKGVEALYHLPVGEAQQGLSTAAVKQSVTLEPLRRSPLRQEHAYKSAFTLY